ncbi:hypothetical protein [Methylobacterium nodulans]|uniref:Pilus formation protein N-terminal domain-containing protein n=1 Tax=Methylobacterium nodulans (strain LMG 21967 / CNCM I-2342 / ORS 2060) TaxID=460265 RepID=B8IBL7_METNO|nr:hypothetical protein [Methylobacterium nodulans]ACL59271.1 conserved hypothetical protein [Methylobacterium nodulans ORS 2060]
MLRAHLFFSITAPAALLALAAQPLVEHSIEAVARPALNFNQLVKGDRLARVQPARSLQKPVAVEITGLGAAKVTLRNEAGDIVYQTDSAANTTLVARDTAVPQVTLRSREGAPVVERSPVPSANDVGTSRRPMPEGCEGAISGLAGHEARRLLPSRCLAQAGPAAFAG